MSAVALSYALEGRADAATIVLSSSLGTTRAMWEPQRTALSGEHAVLSYDHRGHGGSPVPPGRYSLADLGGDVLALLDRLEIARTSWCGISLGGMVGMWLAANAPERIDRLILICTSAHAPPAARWSDRAAAVLEAGGTEVVADAVVERWFTPGYAVRHPECVARARAMLLATPAVGYAGCCAVVEQLDLRGALAQISAPTLVIGAAGDTALPAEHGRLIAEAVPEARFELVGGAHLASIEAAANVNALLAGHLAVSAATRSGGGDG